MGAFEYLMAVSLLFVFEYDSAFAFKRRNDLLERPKSFNVCHAFGAAC